MQTKILDSLEILYLANGTKIDLNSQQLDAIKHIHQFLKSTSKIFVLSGHAGTGKTTVIKKILDNYAGRAVVSAPTNKALQVISSSAMYEGVTIHALLGLQPDVSLEDFNPNEPQFGQIKPSTIQDYNLIVIDEASMINDALFELIESELNNLSRVKVIFMGDKAQLPPISQESSMVFAFDTIYHRELTTLVRQAETNPLISIYDNLRDNIDNENFELDLSTDLNHAEEGVLALSSNEDFRAKLVEVFTSKEYLDDINHAKLIAWRNKTVNQSNIIIRNIVFGESKKILQKGDILTGYRTVKGTRTIPFYVNNCTDYRVSGVSRRQKNKHGIYGYTIKILEKSKFLKGFDEKKIFVVDYKDHKNLHDYAELHDSLVEVARGDKKQWAAYYNFRRDNLMMQSVYTYREGHPRTKDKQIAKDLDYGYAVTCHKVQGSTYDHVFILTKDFKINRNHKERNQMFYVALTRPKKTAIVLV
ncbi:ATP-dependent DNA helicase [Francisella adeliensis]|uniref:AAA family ATPase n=1 Tax=Francisella adeliensis TaxID=2007306 RepID=A0A2Z4XWK8_9GAMM|nr:AAA family ATPase [Francisella adeliensis]AXA33254.1 disulfide oxidoreductase [Francisella adeliensis]MBK2085024.1 AAA family ATPase [Francisella adeliensis]MBK2096985.1 AAA family ATPase [Francisella adeliensis]QIW11480.1 AAA family ATPase [Francisella adeliensis]QIW13355.1 AAA family ATPase [Francisella adeliensis]